MGWLDPFLRRLHWEVASKGLKWYQAGNFGGHKGDWWWKREVQGKVEAKRRYTKWVECVDEEVKRALKKVYKTTKTEAKLAARRR
ncbi:hypothetical protein H5410_003221 [Solanum commersonii]|uniref:Uncharacterized protein n=1 Tax=Solanum commersonii TaxID=4109 RepID=A0A9J6B4F7_SOLCO|nr:hypothetical protein H5410_003221 [Solanum commersonii]